MTTTNKTILSLLIGITISCGISKNYRSESRYKIDNASNGINRELIHQIHFDKFGRKEKEVLFKPSPTIFQKESVFDSKGNLISQITYYDSVKSTGNELLYRYENNVLEQTLAINITNNQRRDTMIFVYTNHLDNLGRVVKAKAIVESDTNTIDYQYTDFDKISSINTKTGAKLITSENYYYNQNGSKQKHTISIPDYNIYKEQYYNYTDTLLTEVISIINADTLSIERIEYDEHGLKKTIEISDYELNEVTKIEIEYK